MWFLTMMNRVVTTFLPAWIIIFALLTLLKPSSFFFLQNWTSLLLAFILFLMGLTIPPPSFQYVFKRPKVVLFGVLCKWIVTVLISIGLGFSFLTDSPDLLAGFILAGSVPSATAASVYTFIANGTVLLSITMSVVDTFISPLITPFILERTIGHLMPIAYVPLISKIFLITLVPIVCGLIVQVIASKFVAVVTPAIQFTSSLLLIFVVISVVSHSQPIVMNQLEYVPRLLTITMIQIVFPMFIGYGFAKIAKISEADSRAIFFETGLCNTALAAILALENISHVAAVPAALNMVLNLSIGALFAILLSKQRISNHE